MSDNTCRELNPPNRILMGPGPSNVHPRVQAAMLAPVVGHLDPYFVSVMEDTVTMLRKVMRTENRLTLPVSGTGSAGMEAAFDNFLEPGDTAVVGVAGFFGERMAENAARTGAKVVRIDAEWGNIIPAEAIEKALRAEKKVKVLALVHAETSTGMLQPLADASRLAKEHGALLLVDAVTSLGGHEIAVDDWGIDICYSGTQKCLGCPPGLAPVTAGEKALAVLKARKEKVHSWYLDLSLLSTYWGSDRFYHHTAPISMVYAFYQALTMIIEEGLENRINRHLRNGRALQAGLEAMGLKLHAQKGHRLAVLTTVRIPEGIDDARIRGRLLNEFDIEIGGGLGTLKGRVWRVGLMGYTSREENLLTFLYSLEKLLSEDGYKVAPGTGVKAAVESLRAK
jgi:alanine-glyoxylate transaminase/serine-glyoxylate transaminase/serine-pyruvate transaminase